MGKKTAGGRMPREFFMGERRHDGYVIEEDDEPRRMHQEAESCDMIVTRLVGDGIRQIGEPSKVKILS